MLYDMLPVLEGWSFKQYDIDVASLEENPITIPKSAWKIISRTKYPGYLVSLFVTVSSKHAELSIEFRDSTGKIKKISSTPEKLYYMGMLQSSPHGMWLARYDESNSVYTMAMTPAPPMPFYATRYQKYQVTVTAKEEDTDLLGFSETVIIIEDYDTFIENVKNLLAPRVTVTPTGAVTPPEVIRRRLPWE